MATASATLRRRRPVGVAARSVPRERMVQAAGLLLLMATSLLLRTANFRVGFWIDEGLSVGIAHHPLADIPSLLRQDGSPPLYYLLLHGWIALFGDSEKATHALSLVFALAAIPTALWAGASLFDRRVGWTFAALVALSPFLTAYAQETRMYALMVLLGLVTTTCFLHAYAFGRRGYRIPFGVALAAMLYTHDWALFYGVGLAIALAVIWRATPTEGGARRVLARDALVGFGTVAILWAPWLPNFVFQALHTAAPWASRPSPRMLLHAPNLLLGGQAGTYVVVLVGGAGAAALWRRGGHDRRVVVPVVVILALAPILVAWLASQASPAWATRYLAVSVAPMLLLAALGIARAGRLGTAGAVLLALSWIGATGPNVKSNARFVSTTLTPMVKRGDLVISTQPEQVPVLAYYLPDGVRFANPFGLVSDTGIVDWRDGPAHFDRTGVDTQLLPLLDRVPVGAHVVLVKPIIYYPDRWKAPWTRRVRDRTLEYEGIMRGDPRFELGTVVPEHFRLPGPNAVQGLLFTKTRA